MPDPLGRVPYFRVLSARKRGALARRFRSVAFARHESVFVEGEPCDGLWIVVEGRLKVFRTSPRGREQVLHVEGPGATLGEVPLFDMGGYVASATTLSAARLIWVPRRELEDLCREHPEVALAIIATMARRVRAFAGLAGDLALRPVQARLGRLLLEEAWRVGRQTPRGLELTLPGTRDEIAARIGTVREPASRALSALARQGLVTVSGRHVLVRDVRGLEEVAGEGVTSGKR
ncbi:MAG TPA: Crp/Fnr family transcriptional regulator [Methylomirabilota bacterium]|nr:Crp/Fnr family transcriptional regulator [Methylomirabilota bacterium]